MGKIAQKGNRRIMNVLITGAAGFIGSHFVKHFVDRYPKWNVKILESFNYASGLDRLKYYRNKVELIYHDIKGIVPDYSVKKLGKLDYIFHLAAETHVDNSMVNPRTFLEANTNGTFNMLEYARLHQAQLKMFFYISTDEVYGPAPPGTDHTEGYPHRPSNPYSATKAGAEDLVYCYSKSMGVPTIITNTMNNIGEMQHSEKYIPKIIKACLLGEHVTVHGTPDNPGSRKYLYAKDHADAINFLLANGRNGERYNVVGQEEINNLELVRKIEVIMGKKVKIKFLDFHSTRPGHDLRYSLDGKKMADMGWVPPTDVDTTLKKIVSWYENNQEWL